MSEAALQAAPATQISALSPRDSAPAAAACEECAGSGGWFRYEPALEPAPGLLYLSCLACRGSGHTGGPRA